MYNNIAVHLLRELLYICLVIFKLYNILSLWKKLVYILSCVYCSAFIFQECMPGFYGNNCERQCSQNCKAITGCDKITGHCVGGCKTGWRGMSCDGNVLAEFSDWSVSLESFFENSFLLNL